MFCTLSVSLSLPITVRSPALAALGSGGRAVLPGPSQFLRPATPRVSAVCVLMRGPAGGPGGPVGGGGTECERRGDPRGGLFIHSPGAGPLSPPVLSFGRSVIREKMWVMLPPPPGAAPHSLGILGHGGEAVGLCTLPGREHLFSGCS